MFNQKQKNKYLKLLIEKIKNELSQRDYPINDSYTIVMCIYGHNFFKEDVFNKSVIADFSIFAKMLDLFTIDKKEFTKYLDFHKIEDHFLDHLNNLGSYP